MGAAAAAESPDDANNVTMNSIDDAPIGVSEDAGGAEPLLGASNLKNFTTLYNEIMNSGSTVTLDGNYAFDEVRDASFVNGVVIRKNVSIDGNGAVIDGSGKARIFYVPDTVNSFTLKDITIKNAYTTSSGAVALFQEKMKTVNIEGTFINNTASLASVFNFAGGVSGNVNIDGNFTDNVATDSHAAFRFGPVTDSVINIKGKYHNNRAIANVGGVLSFLSGISDDSAVNINGEFTNNHAGTFGGVIFGAVYGNVILDGTFTGNTANRDGGVAFINDLHGNVILNGVYEGNTANDGGGVAYLSGTVYGNVTLDGTFTGNTAGSNGGVFHVNNDVNGNVSLDGTFTGNTADMGGVAYVNGAVNGNVTLKGDYERNTAGNGAILSTSTVTGKVDLTSATVKGNNATWGSNAMYIVNGQQPSSLDNILYDNSTFIGNNYPPVRMSTGFSWSNVPKSWYTGKMLNIPVTVNGIGNASGMIVYLTDNGVKVGDFVLDENGKTNLTFSLNTAGSHNLFAEFAGSELYACSSSRATVTVNDGGDNLKTYTDLVNEIMNAADTGHVKLDGVYVYDPVLDKDYQPMNLYYDMDIDGNGAVIDGAGFNKQLFNIYGDFNLTNVTVQNVKNNVVVAQNDGLTINLNGTFTQNTRVLQARHKSMTITLDGTYSYNDCGASNSASVLDMNDNTNSDRNTMVYLYGDYIGNKRSATGNGATIAMFSHFKKVVLQGNFINNTDNSDGGIAWFKYYGDIEVTGNYTNNTGQRMFTIQSADNPTDWNISSVKIEHATFENNTYNFIYCGATRTESPLLFIDYNLFLNNTVDYLVYGDHVYNNLTITNNRLYNNTVNVNSLAMLADTAKYSNITNNTGLDENDTKVNTLYSLTLNVAPSTVYSDRNISVSISLTGLTDYTDAYVLLDITGQPTRMVELDSTGKAQLILSFDTGQYTAVARYTDDETNTSKTSSADFIVKLKQVKAYRFKDLYNLIYNRTSDDVDLDGDTFLFDPTTDTPYTTGIIVPSGVTIEGNGAVIDADGQSRIFQLTGNNKVNNITFKNGNFSGDGGAISTSGQNIVISNSTFDSNSITQNGGAIFINSQKVRIDSCNFTSNSAVRNGGAIYTSSASTQVLIINSSFIGNKQTGSSYNGAAISTGAEHTAVWYCNFTDNSAAGIGAVYINKYRNSISYCNFIGNTAKAVGGLRIPNLRYWDGVTINGSTEYRGYTNLTFINNTANDHTGAMYIADSYAGTFYNLTFINNSAKNYAGALNSAVNAAVILNKAVFKNNTAGTNAAAIYYDKANTLTINNAVFDNNKASSTMSVVNNGTHSSIHLSGGNSYYDAFYGTAAKKIILNKVTFDEEYVDSETITATPNLRINLADAVINMTIVNETGDILYTTNLSTNETGDLVVDKNMVPDYVDLRNTRVLFTFEGDDNYLASNGEGYLGYGDFYLLQKYIDENIADGNHIIVLTCNYTYHLVLDNVVEGILIKDDDITIDGNGFVVDAQKMSRIFTITGNNVTIKNINLINGKFTGNAGAILISGANATIKDANFTGNTATNGGAVYVNGVNATIMDANFTGNTATNAGGAVYVNGVNATIMDANFTGNKASDNGGAVYVNGNNCSIMNANFTGNSAKNGAGLFINLNILDANVTNCNFTSNTATDRGAGIFVNSNAKANITDCNFTSNTATNNGAGIYINKDGAMVNITDCNFTENTANTGAAIYLNTNSMLNITRSRFIGNIMKTSTSMGIVYLNGLGNVTNCTFKDNIILGINPANAVALQLGGSYKGNVKGNIFSDRMAKYYEISNAGVLTLTNNPILNGKDSARIYNTNIITNMSARVLDNKTLTGLSIGNLVVLNATDFMDDHENLIDNTKLTFIVYNETGDVIAQVPASIDDGVAYGDYYILSVPRQYVSIKDVTLDSVHIGAIENINPGLCNISIVFDSNPLGYGHNQTVTITLSGNDTVLVPVRNAPIKIKVTRESNNITIFELTNTTNSNGVYSFKLNSSILEYGVYRVNVTFDGNGDYKANSTCDIFNVSKNVPELTVNVNSSKVSPGESVMLTFNLTSDNKGLDATVSVKINDEDPFNVDIIDGVGSVIIPGENLTKARLYNVNVTYNGDTNISPVDNSTNFTVLKVTNLTVSADSISYGDDAVINITLLDADGNPVNGKVTVKVGITKKIITVTDGKGSLVVSGLAKGEYPISAEYRGDDTYLKSVNNTESVTVNTVTPTVNVTVNSTFTTLDDVIVNITTDTAGTYTITVNGESKYYSLAVGENLVNLGKYSANNYSISVDFAETDSTHAIETITKEFRVVFADTPIVVGDLNISVVDDVIVNVGVPSGLAGQNITITINGTTKNFVVGSDGNVSANFTDANIKAGTYEINVTFTGNSIYSANTTNATLTINKINTDLST